MIGKSVQKWATASPMLLALMAFAPLCFAPQMFNDGDTSWHLATGQWIVEHRGIPHSDPFSFTFRGHPWTAHEWLVDVAMAGAFAVAGWAGLAVLFASAAALALALVTRELLRWLPPRHVIAGLALLVLVVTPFTLARPHVITWPLLVLWTIALLRARERGRAPHLAWALLILAWANLHASYIFALALAAGFALEALVKQANQRLAVVREWGLFGLVSFIAALVTPHGIDGLLYPFQVSGMAALPLIQEWRKTSLPQDWAFVFLASAAMIVVIVRWQRVGAVRLLVLGVLAALAVAHARHQPLFAFVTILVLAPAVSAQREPDEPLWPRGTTLSLILALVAIAGLRLALPLERRDGMNYPLTAITRLPAELRSEPVFNSYGFGGPLILHGIPPFIDGRADMYGDAFTFMQDKVESGDAAAFALAVQRWRLRWTILPPSSPLVAILDRLPGWRRLHADRWAVVHVRDATAGPPPKQMRRGSSNRAADVG